MRASTKITHCFVNLRTADLYAPFHTILGTDFPSCPIINSVSESAHSFLAMRV